MRKTRATEVTRVSPCHIYKANREIYLSDARVDFVLAIVLYCGYNGRSLSITLR